MEAVIEENGKRATASQVGAIAPPTAALCPSSTPPTTLLTLQVMHS